MWTLAHLIYCGVNKVKEDIEGVEIIAAGFRSLNLVKS